MRILIAHEAAAGGGGVESYLAALVPALIGRGHELAFLHHDPRAEPGPIRIAHGGMASISVRDDGAGAAWRQVAEFRPDVCFSHNMRHLDVDARLADGWPTVKMMHGYFGTCVSAQKAHTFPAVVACTRTFGAPCLALYAPRHCGRLRPLTLVREFRWASRQQRLFSRYAHVVVASEHMRREYVRHGVTAARVTVAPLFSTEQNAGAPRPRPDWPTVVFAGRMTNLKGGEALVRAVVAAGRALGRPVRLVAAGAGPAADGWRRLAASQGVAAEFPGWLGGGARTNLFRGATLIAVPSLWPEPFGLVGLEAATHGVPAVAFDTGGIGEWLRDGVNGRLVREAGSADALGAAIADLLGDDAQLDRLERGALAAARDFTVDAHMRTLDRVFSQVSANAVTVA